MSQRIGRPRPVLASARRCCVKGCARPVRGDAIVCGLHARVLADRATEPQDGNPDGAA